MRNLAFAAAILLAACSATLSPREQAKAVDLSWAAVLVAANAAVHAPQLADKPEVVAQIRAATTFSTASVHSYHAEAAKCLRDPTSGSIGPAHPGDVCDPSLVHSLLIVAQTAAGNAGDLLTSLGFAPKGA